MSRTLILSCLLLLTAAFAVEAPPTVPGEKPKLGVVLDDGSFDPSQGIPLRSINPGSSAAALGMKPGDLLSSFNGKAIHSSADLLAALGECKIGDTVTAEVMRAGKKETLTGKLIPPATAGTLNQEIDQVRRDLNEMQLDAQARTREPTLGELIRELQMLQAQFPRAAAEFKKIYPDGEFSISIRITSDKNSANPVDLMQLTDPKAKPPAEKPDGQAAPAPAPVPAPHPPAEKPKK